MCRLEPKLMASGYLTKYYTAGQLGKKGCKTVLNKLESTLVVANPKRSQPISNGITNILDYISRHDLLITANTCMNPNITVADLPHHEGIKLAYYNHEFEQSLEKFSQLMIAFMKFLQHSPHRMLPQTLQYLNYLINIVLSEPDPSNATCLAD